MANAGKIYGLVAESAPPAATMGAAAKVRDADFRKWDVFTPYPVHGMDQAMGLKSSKVGWFSFIGGATGSALGKLMILWMNAHHYALPLRGQPMYIHHRTSPPLYEFNLLSGSRRAPP